MMTSNRNIQPTEKQLQDLCRYANLAQVAEQRMTVQSLCYKREPAGVHVK